MDVLHFPESKRGNKFALTMIDVASRWAYYVVPLSKTQRPFFHEIRFSEWQIRDGSSVSPSLLHACTSLTSRPVSASTDSAHTMQTVVRRGSGHARRNIPRINVPRSVPQPGNTVNLLENTYSKILHSRRLDLALHDHTRCMLPAKNSAAIFSRSRSVQRMISGTPPRRVSEVCVAVHELTSRIVLR